MTPSRIFINIKRCKALVYKRFRCAHDAYTYFAVAQQRKRQGQREKDKGKEKRSRAIYLCSHFVPVLRKGASCLLSSTQWRFSQLLICR